MTAPRLRPLQSFSLFTALLRFAATRLATGVGANLIALNALHGNFGQSYNPFTHRFHGASVNEEYLRRIGPGPAVLEATEKVPPASPCFPHH